MATRPPKPLLHLVRHALRLPDRALTTLAGGPITNDRGATLDPAIGALLALVQRLGLPRMNEQSVADARAQLGQDEELVAPSAPDMALVEDRWIAGPAQPLRVRIYRPTRARELPALVYFHGGGFVVGDLDSHDAVCRRIARSARCAVVAVDYRLAPEHSYPAAVEDAEAAFRWVSTNAATLGIDATRVGIAGDSAGANLSAVVSRRLRDAGAALPKAQILIYPATDLTMSHPSIETFATGFYLERALMEWFMDHYVPSPRLRRQPDASPLFAEHLEGLPPAAVIVGGFDPLRDEGEAYAAALEAAGVETHLRCEDAMIHAFINMAGASPAADQALERITGDVARLL